MKKEKLMILGAAKFTVPLIELAKQMGFETLVVSIAGNYPGFLVADRSYEVDVRDKETILEIARKEGISGIVTDQTDLPVPTIAYVAEKMGLPGIGYECAMRITNKLMCRKHCQRIGFPVPAFYHASTLEEARKGAMEIGFPLVVKPTDSMAARGVSRVNNLAELERKFKNGLANSTSRVVLLEEYFQGKKIILTGFIADYKFTNLILADHKHFDIPDLFIVRQTTVPSNLDQKLQKKILELNTRLFESFGARFGIAFSEFKVNEESGEVSLMEAALPQHGSLKVGQAGIGLSPSCSLQFRRRSPVARRRRSRQAFHADAGPRTAPANRPRAGAACRHLRSRKPPRPGSG